MFNMQGKFFFWEIKDRIGFTFKRIQCERFQQIERLNKCDFCVGLNIQRAIGVKMISFGETHCNKLAYFKLL